MKTALEILQGARAGVASGKWCKHQYTDMNGNHCLTEWLNLSSFGADPNAANKAYDRVSVECPLNIIFSNDAPETTREDVLRWLDLAIEKERADQ